MKIRREIDFQRIDTKGERVDRHATLTYKSRVSKLLELLQFLQPGQYDLFACLLYLPSKENFVKDCIHLDVNERLSREGEMMGSHLVEVENQIKFANVIKERIWY